MATLDDLLAELEGLLAELEGLDEPSRRVTFQLLDGIDSLHRMALYHLGEAVDDATLWTVRESHPAVAWLFDAYGVGVDQRAAAEAALEKIRPYVQSHGGRVVVLDVTDGVVRLRMSGSCAGCTASAVTLREGVESALREGFPGFAGIRVEEDDAAPHPPPGATPVEIQPVRR